MKNTSKSIHINLIKAFLAIIILVFLTQNSIAQTVRIVRTDVDSTRSNIVTASYLFGFDIYIDNLPNVNSMTFSLKYNFANSVRFSGYQIGDFGPNATILPIIPNPNSTNAEDIITFGVFSPLKLSESNFDNPKIIHLEFIVLQTAPNGQDIVFQFINPKATAYIDSINNNRNIVTLKSTDTKFTIHSYVSVWPGDADNSGIVDLNDWNLIDANKALEVKNKRRFKRKTPTTMWVPQTVLVWDDAMQTYIDCDGDGEITLSDAYVVKQNMSFTKTQAEIKDSKVQNGNDFSKVAEKTIEINQNSLSLPLNLGFIKPYSTIELRGVISNYQIVKSQLNFIGVNSGKLFDNLFKAKIVDFNKETGEFEFIITTFDDNQLVQNNGNLANLIFEKSVNNLSLSPIVLINEIKCMDANRNTFYMQPLINSDVETQSSDDVEISNNSIIFKNLDILDNNFRLKVTDITGVERINITSMHSNQLNLDYLETGVYILQMKINNNVSSKKIMIIK